MNQCSPEIFELWNALSKARWRREVFEQEMKANPWESNDSQVKAAWDALTDPRNLAGLEQWGSEPEEMNATAREAAAVAIRCCRMKAGIASA